ncbi:MAG: ATP-binding protein [Thiomargarita sp.]|nr:ATP-binding protein [Thiomargarita sp.]
MKLQRHIDYKEIQKRLETYKVTALLGPRQSGKTTLARQFQANHYFDLENPRDLAQFQNPQLTLERCRGLIIIDEIQRQPELFPLIRFLVDTRPEQHYFILGSASRDLIRQSSESLAGRISYHTLLGFRHQDVSLKQLEQLWLRGNLPSSFLAANNEISYQWREDYIRTFLERDIPALGIRIPAKTLHRFWQMVSHYHGNMINFSEIGRSFGIADTTVRRYIDIFVGTFMIRTLQPWFVNLGKRLVKRPKLYFCDSGIFHALLAIETPEALYQHPKLGSSWEGFALDCVWRSIGKSDDKAYFWATHSGAEVDLFWQHEGQHWACEFKFSDAPTLTKSMRSALTSLNLEKLWVIYPGNTKYPIHEQIEVLPLKDVPAYWEY